jgi:hypothetical protein
MARRKKPTPETVPCPEKVRETWAVAEVPVEEQLQHARKMRDALSEQLAKAEAENSILRNRGGERSGFIERNHGEGRKLVARLYDQPCALNATGGGLNIERVRLVDQALRGEIHAWNAGVDVEPTLHILSRMQQLHERVAKMEQMLRFVVEGLDQLLDGR